MNGLPAILTRPDAVLPEQSPAPADAGVTTLRLALDSGVPMRISLSGDRSLVLSVGLGLARRWLNEDPAAVAISAPPTPASPADVAVMRDPDVPIARLTLVEGATIGDSAPVVVGVAMRLCVDQRAVVDVTVDAMTITAGSLRSPGEYGSTMTLRWRAVATAGDSGPTLVLGDDTIPRPRALDLRRRRK